MAAASPQSPGSRPRRRVVLLGATGSIGASTLRVLAAHPDRLELVGIAARSDWRRLAQIAREHGVRSVAIHDEGAWKEAKASGEFPKDTRLLVGAAGLAELAALPEADT
ncbi:MAG TPA: 1-deoxy-D-xylulose-5-phosphate reductoisomerase, partial [Opitutaceae bacterium]